MEIEVLLGMGAERRETVIEIADEHLEKLKAKYSDLATLDAIEFDLVRSWLYEQIEVGWESAGESPVEIEASIELGTERRETTIEIAQEDWDKFIQTCKDHRDEINNRIFHTFIWDWMRSQLWYSWVTAEGCEGGTFFLENIAPARCRRITKNSSLPNTVRMRQCPHCNERIAPAS